jgi:hypothetical protein
MPLGPNDIQYQVFGPNGTVYPGHAVTIAYLIMLTYPSLQDARVRGEGATCPAALSNGAIPGAGGCVYSALDVLAVAFSDGVDKAFEFGDDCWQGETENGYQDRRESGQTQAESIKDKFREVFANWSRVSAAAAA